MILIDYIKNAMREQGISQKELAKRLGITQSAMSNMLQSDMRVSSLERIASVIGIDIKDFLSKEESQDKGDAEEERKTHVHGYMRIGDRIVEITSMQELRDAVTACEVNYLK